MPTHHFPLTGPDWQTPIRDSGLIVPKMIPRLTATPHGIRATLTKGKFGVKHGVNFKVGLPEPSRSIRVTSKFRFAEGSKLGRGGKLLAPGIDNRPGGASWTGGDCPPEGSGGCSARFMWKLIESGPHAGKHGVYPYYYVPGMKGPTGIYGPMMRVVKVGSWMTCQISVSSFSEGWVVHFYVDGVTSIFILQTLAPFNKIMFSGFAGGDDSRWAMDGVGVMEAREFEVEF